MTVEHLGPDLFVVADLLTAAECADFIERGEGMGFEPAAVATAGGPRMMPGVRTNDRVAFDDPDLAAALWPRARPFTPPERNGGRASGLCPAFRFYRYDPGQRFRRHTDGITRLETGEASQFTLLFYLNDGFTGGETVFHIRGGVPETTVRTIPVQPRARAALFFAHEWWHEGAALTDGRKYVLRTDVMYRPV